MIAFSIPAGTPRPTTRSLEDGRGVIALSRVFAPWKGIGEGSAPQQRHCEPPAGAKQSHLLGDCHPHAGPVLPEESPFGPRSPGPPGRDGRDGVSEAEGLRAGVAPGYPRGSSQ